MQNAFFVGASFFYEKLTPEMELFNMLSLNNIIQNNKLDWIDHDKRM
jgi:hypothetical protein